MKIKELREVTGLTDRTIRYYMEEGLLAPAFSENYVGRKSYDFTMADAEILQQISVLRKFGFSIEEIKAIEAQNGKTAKIIESVHARKKKCIEEEQNALEILDKLERNREYTLPELAQTMAAFSAGKSLPKEDNRNKLERIFKKHKKGFFALGKILDILVFIGTMLASGTWLYMFLTEWKYPHIRPEVSHPVFWIIIAYIMIGAPIICGIVCLIIRSFDSKKAKKFPIYGCFCLCVLLCTILPSGFLGNFALPIESETRELNHYNQLDEIALPRDGFYLSMMPPRQFSFEKTEGRLEEYYYRCRATFDVTTDIYAEWSFSEKTFRAEIQRVSMLYDAWKNPTDEYWTTETLQKGNYICLMRYHVDKREGKTTKPFEPVDNSYTFYIFAYDEKNQKIRYIVCDSMENGADQPYYLTLDW